MNCHRTACQQDITHRPFAAVYNVPSVIGGHNKYCVPCARRLIEANPSFMYEFHDNHAVQGNQELRLPVPAQGMAGDGRPTE
jgi:hypothetical protein